jgi:hypothetical protein
MSSRSDEYRHRAEAKNRAAETNSPSIKAHSKKWRAAGCCLPSKWSGWTGRGLPDATRTRAISAVFAHARKMGLECIVSDSAYRSGRSPDSLEMKNSNAPAVKHGASSGLA